MNIRMKLLASIICFSFVNCSIFAATTINTADCSCSYTTILPTNYFPNKDRDSVNPVNFASGLGMNGGLQKCDCSNQSSLLSRSTIIRHTKCKDGYTLCDVSVNLYNIKVTTKICSPNCDCGAGSYYWNNAVIGGGTLLSDVSRVASASSNSVIGGGGEIISPSGCAECGSYQGVTAVSYFGDNKDSGSCFVPGSTDGTGTYVWADPGAKDGLCYMSN